jgi:hypothetical protein
MDLLSTLTFDPASNLREIGAKAFSRCPCLKSSSLPASLSVIHCEAFLGSSIEKVSIDTANSSFFVSGDFLIASKGMMVVKYFGLAQNAIVVRACKSLGDYCFTNSRLITISFEDGSQLTQIGAFACSSCLSLRSICIPASVELLGDSCFNSCGSLAQFTFEPGSRLAQIGTCAFAHCSALTSICIPVQVETIPAACFHSAKSLAELSFEEGSKLTRICSTALKTCYSLRLIRVPVHLEVLDLSVFAGCKYLSQLIFEHPSQLRQLDLPPSNFGSLCIPDSVETITGLIGKVRGQGRLLQFSHQSRLMTIHLSHIVPRARPLRRPQTIDAVFLSLSEELLRKFRCQFELG